MIRKRQDLFNDSYEEEGHKEYDSENDEFNQPDEVEEEQGYEDDYQYNEEEND